MKISVILKNGKKDNVPVYLLGAMIAAGEVTSLRRADGWVKIGVDPVRNGETSYCYYGPERRKLNQQRLCTNCPYFVNHECTKQICLIRYIQLAQYTKQN